MEEIQLLTTRKINTLGFGPCIFPHFDFQCLILKQTIKKYSLLVKLNQRIKQI